MTTPQLALRRAPAFTLALHHYRTSPSRSWMLGNSYDRNRYSANLAGVAWRGRCASLTPLHHHSASPDSRWPIQNPVPPKPCHDRANADLGAEIFPGESNPFGNRRLIGVEAGAEGSDHSLNIRSVADLADSPDEFPPSAHPVMSAATDRFSCMKNTRLVATSASLRPSLRSATTKAQIRPSNDPH
jgi:hypothetical protein